MMNHNASRNCTRCGLPLTDAASMEAGIGPICRKLDNALLARLIPSNLPSARASFEAVDLTTAAPETVKTLNEVYEAIFSEEALTRADWRLEVKRIEWALSYPANNSLRRDLTDAVRALGYVGLASLWNGDAATGKATVQFLNNRIVVSGPRNKAVRMAFRSIYGRVFHDPKKLIEAAAWSFPATQYEAVFMAVLKHYPNFDGLMETMEAAKAAVAAATPAPVQTAVIDTPVGPVEVPLTVVPTVKAAAKCSILSAGVLLKVVTPYKASYIAALKTAFPYNDRRWNATERCWEVAQTHKAKVEELTKEYFGSDALEAVTA